MKRTITIKPDGTITIEESDEAAVDPRIVLVPRHTGDVPIYPPMIPAPVPIYKPIWRVFPPGWPGTFTC